MSIYHIILIVVDVVVGTDAIVDFFIIIFLVLVSSLPSSYQSVLYYCSRWSHYDHSRSLKRATVREWKKRETNNDK